MKRFLFLVVLLVAWATNLFAANGDYQSIASTNWTSPTTWQADYGAGFVAAVDYPGQNAGTGVVTIQNNTIVTLDQTIINPLGSLVLNNGANNSGIDFNGVWTLNVTGATTINGSATNGINKYIQVNTGTFTTASVSMTDGGQNTRDCYILITTGGTVTVLGSIIMAGSSARNYIYFNGACTLYIGNTMTGGGITSTVGGAVNPTSGTINYNANGAQAIGNYTYYNLATSVSGIKTLPAAAINIAGTLDVSNSTLAFDAAATRIITVTGNLSGNGTIDMSAGNQTHTLNLNGATNSIGTLTTAAVSSTVAYNLNGIQAIFASANYRNLTIAGGNTKTLQGPSTIGGNLTVSTGTFELAAQAISVSGTTTLTGILNDGTGGTTYTLNDVNFTGGTIQTSVVTSTYNIGGALTCNTGNGTIGCGNFTISGTTTLTAARTLTFSATSNTGTKSFTDVVVNGRWTNNNAVTAINISGSLTVNAGATFNAGTGMYTFTGNPKLITGTLVGALNIPNTTIDGSYTNSITGGLTISTALNGAGSLTQAANSRITYGGSTDILPSLDASANGNIVNYNSGVQNIKAINYYHLQATGGSTKTIVNAGTTIIAGDFTTATTLTVNTQIDVIGSWNVTGNTVFGGNTSIINIDNGIAITGGTLTISNTIGGNKSINVTHGDIVVNATRTLTVGGVNSTHAITITDGYLNNAGTVTLYSNALRYCDIIIGNATTTTWSANAMSLNNITINASSSSITSLGATTTVRGTITLENNVALALNGKTLATYDDIFINSGAELNINAAAILQLSNGKVLHNRGVLTVVGTDMGAGVATITRIAVATNYTILQTSADGADGLTTVKAQNYLIDYLGIGGFKIDVGTINGTDNFSNGTFDHGVATGTYLDLIDLSFANFTTTGVVFNSGATYNVTRTNGGTGGVISFDNYTGTRTGEPYEHDNGTPGSYINWINTATTWYSKTAGTHNASLTTDWAKNRDGSGGSPASVTDMLQTLVVQNGDNMVVDGNIDVLELKVENGGILTIGNNATQRIVTIRSKLDVQDGGSFKAGTAGISTHLLRIYGNINTNITGDLNLYAPQIADVEFRGSATSVYGTSSPTFNKVFFKNPSSTTAGVNMIIFGDVTFEAGSVFTDAGYTHTVYGNWDNTGAGTYTATGNAQITFNTTNNLINISGANCTFNKINCVTNSNKVTITNTTSFNANGAFTVSGNNTVESSAPTYINSDMSIANGSTFTMASNTINFNGLSAQALDFNNTTFFNISFAGAGAKSISNNIIANGTFTIAATVTDFSDDILTSHHHKFYGTTTISPLNLPAASNFNGIVEFIGNNANLTSATAANIITLGTASIIINKSNGQYLQIVPTPVASTLTVNIQNDVTVNTGYLYLADNATLNDITPNTKSFTVNASGTGGNSTQLRCRDENNFPINFGNYSFAPTTRVYYDGTAGIIQTIRGNDTTFINYPDLYLATATTTKEVAGDLNIDGILDINGASITLDLKNYNCNIFGNITSSVLTDRIIHNPTIAPFNGTLTFDNDNAVQTITAITMDVNNLGFTLDNPLTSYTKSFTNASSIIVRNNFSATATGGTSNIRLTVNIGDNTIVDNNGNGTFTLGDNVTLQTSATTSFHNSIGSAANGGLGAFSGGKNLSAGSIVCYAYAGAGAQTIASAPGLIYGGIDFKGNTDKVAPAPLDINGSVTASANTPYFIDGGFTHTVAGDWQLRTTNYGPSLTYNGSPLSTGKIVLDGQIQNIGINGATASFINVDFKGDNSGSAVHTFVYGGTRIYGTAHIKDDGLHAYVLDANTRNINIGNTGFIGVPSSDWLIDGPNSTFTQTTGTFTFDGTNYTQNVSGNANSAFGNFTISKPNVWPGGGNNVTVVATSDIWINGDVTFTNYHTAGWNSNNAAAVPYAALDISNHTLHWMGSGKTGGSAYTFAVYSNTGFTATGSTLSFESGDGTQTFYLSPVGVYTFNNMNFENNNGSKAFGWGSTINLTGNMFINNTTLNAGTAPINIAGNWDNLGAFQHANTVTFNNGTHPSTQTISTSTFNNLVIAGDADPTHVTSSTGELTIGGSMTLQSKFVAGANMTISGAWTNTVAGGYFVPSTRTVYFNSSSSVTIATGDNTSGGKEFYNVTFASTNSTPASSVDFSLNGASPIGDLIVQKDLNIPQGRLNVGAHNVTVGGADGGDFVVGEDGRFAMNTGVYKLTLACTKSGTYNFNPGLYTTANASTYNALTINSGGNKNVIYKLYNNLTTNNSGAPGADLTIASGQFNLNGFQYTLTNATADVVLSSANSVLKIDAGANFRVDGGIITNNGGDIYLVGSSSSRAKLTRNTANYTFTQTSGKLYAYYCDIQNTSGNGLDIQGGTIDNYPNNFSESKFSSGTGNYYIKIGNTVTYDMINKIENVQFSSGPALYVYNHSGNDNSMIFKDAIGASKSNESDGQAQSATLGEIRWQRNGNFWDFNGSGNWSDGTKWSNGTPPVAGENAYIIRSAPSGNLAATIVVTVDVPLAECNRITLDNEASANTITLAVGTNTLDANEKVDISAGSTVSSNGTITVGAGWSNSGTFTAGASSLVKFDANGGTGAFSVTNGASAFNSITFDAPLSTYTFGATITANKDISISYQTTVDVSGSNYTTSISGNWDNQGTFKPQNGIVNFTGTSGTQTISGGPFYTLNINGNCTKQLLTGIGVGFDLSIGAGLNNILDASNNDIFITRHWTNNSTNGAPFYGFTQGSSNTVFFNGVNQNIDVGSQLTNWQNLSLIGTGTKTWGGVWAGTSTINGLFSIGSSVGTVNFLNKNIQGSGSNTFDVSGSPILWFRKAFPANFGTVNMGTSRAIYRPQSAAEDNQTVVALPNGSKYYTLELWARGATAETKTLAGDITVEGNLTVQDQYTSLNVQSHTITLQGVLNFNNATILPWTWGANGTLYHTTNNFNPTANITTVNFPFNNLKLGSSGTTTSINSNIQINGDLTVEGGVTLNQRTFTITGAIGNSTFQMGSGSLLQTAVIQAIGTALPVSFKTYNIINGTVQFNAAAGTTQDIPVAGINYGNIIASNTVFALNIPAAAGTWNVLGNFNLGNSSTLNDNGNDITIGGLINYTNVNYLPTNTITLNGGNQYFYCQGGTDFELKNLHCSGTDYKIIGDNGGDIITINGDLIIDEGVTLTPGPGVWPITDPFTPPTTANTSDQIIFNGDNWNNNGAFFTNANVTFAGYSNTVQTINPGPSATTNFFRNIIFDRGDATATPGTAGTTSFINTLTAPINVADINGSITIGGALTNIPTINFGNVVYSYTIAGNITNNGGTFNSALADFTFDGNAQTIGVSLTAQNITLTSGGISTKTMGGAWVINNLTIGSTTTLATGGLYNITLTGNWDNNGVFNHGNAGTVTFNATAGIKTINNAKSLPTINTSAFNNLVFNNTTYQLVSNNKIIRGLDINSGATLDLNGNSLYHGNNNAFGPKTINIWGTLKLTAGSYLYSDNSNAIISTINVKRDGGGTGTLQLEGASGNPANMTRYNTGGTNLTVDGNISADNYSIEWLSNAGLNLTSSAVVNPVKNLSNGSFSNLATAPSSYISLNNDLTLDATIDNVTFNYSGNPPANTYCVKRISGTGTNTIDFTNISGTLGCQIYSSNTTVATVNVPTCQISNWTGNINSDWSNAGNWSNNEPDQYTNVTIAWANFTGAKASPTITAFDETCKQLSIVDKALTIANGAKLETSSDVLIGNGGAGSLTLNGTGQILVGGNWTVGVSGTLNAAANSTVEFTSDGSINITNRTQSFANIKFSGTGRYTIVNGYSISGITNSVNITGSVTISDGTFVAPAGTIFVGANFDLIGGTFNPSNGRVRLNGTGTISGAGFYNLWVTSGVYTVSGPVTINDSLNVFSTLIATNTLTMKGVVYIRPSGTFNDGNNANHIFSGNNWFGTGSFISGGTNGTITFTGGNQILLGGSFTNLTLAGNGTKTWAGNVSIYGNFAVSTPIAVNFATPFTTTHLPDNTTGVFSVVTGVTLNVSAANGFPASFNDYQLHPACITNYNGSIAQTIYGAPYGVLNLTGTGTTKTLGGISIVQGNLTIGAGVTLDVDAVKNYWLSIQGNFNNNSTGSFLAQNGEISFNGSANQTIDLGTIGTTGTKTFNNIRISQSGAYLVYPSNTNPLVIAGTLNITSGSFDLNGQSITIGGNLLCSGSGIISYNQRWGGNTGTVTMNSTSGATIQSNGSVLYNLTLSGDDAADLFTVSDALTCNGNFQITKGIFDGGSNTVSLGVTNQTVLIDAPATFKVGASGHLQLGGTGTTPSTLTVNGTIDIIGIAGNEAWVQARSVGGRYNFNVNGTINTSYFVFRDMYQSGINITNTATITALSHGTFTVGYPGKPMLDIEALQTITCLDITFSSNPGGGAKNCKNKNIGGYYVTIQDPLGDFSGATYEDDDLVATTGTVRWTGNITNTWTGEKDQNWFDAANWNQGHIPDLTENAIIATSTKANYPKIDDAKTEEAKCKKLTINAGTVVTIESTDIAYPDLVTAGDITINGNLYIKNINDLVKCGGSFYNNATFSSGSATVELTANTGTQTCKISSSNFYNLKLTGSATYLLTGNSNLFTIKKNLELTAGSINANTITTLQVGGNFINTGGIFTPSASTLQFNPTIAATYDINPGGASSSIFNLRFDAPASTRYRLITNNATVTGNLNINSGELDLNTKDLIFGDAVGSDAISVTGANSQLTIQPNTSLKLYNNTSLTVSSGATISIIGTDDATRATVTRNGITGSYSFAINDGTIKARWYKFEYMNASGIQINSSATLNTTYHLQDGIFDNGTAGGRFLLLECSLPSDPYQITNVKFNIGPAKNCKRTVGNAVQFYDPYGNLGSYLYEDDNAAALTGKVRWFYSQPQYTWLGFTTDWSDANNWIDQAGTTPVSPAPTTGLGTDVIVISIPKVAAGKVYPIINTTVDVKSVSVANLASLTLNTGTLWCHYDAANSNGGSMDNAGAFTAAAGTTVKLDNAWTNSGAYNASGNHYMLGNGPATVDFFPGASAFNNLYFQTTGVPSNTNFRITTQDVTVNNNITISTPATLTVTNNARTITVKGNWTNTGTYTPALGGTGRVYFNNTGAGTQSINNGSSEFYNVEFNGNKTKQFTDNIVVRGELKINAGSNIGSTNGKYIDIYNSWNNLGGTFAYGTNTVNFKGSPSNINGSSTSFYDVNIPLGATLTGTANFVMDVKHNWTNNGTFTHNNSTITFSSVNPAVSTLSGTAYATEATATTNAFKNIVINTNSTLVAPINIVLLGNITNNGTYTHSNGFFFLKGIGAQSINGSSNNTAFYNLIKNTNQNLTIGDATATNKVISVTNAFTWTDNNDQIIVGNGQKTTFEMNNGLIINPGCTLTSTIDGIISDGGNWTNNGTFTHGGGTVNLGVSTGLFTINNTTTFSSINIINGNTYSIASGVTLTASQLKIKTGGTLSMDNTSNLTVTKKFTNDGTWTCINCSVNLTGTTGLTIDGLTSGSIFTNLTLNDVTGTTLMADITVNGSLTLVNGDLDLTSKILTLGSTASIVGETNARRIKAATTGTITTTRNIVAPCTNENFGNMGLEITTGSILGSTIITRGHTAESPLGFPSTKRYFDISPTTNTGLNATLKFYYLDNELNGQSEVGVSAEDNFELWRFNGTVWMDKYSSALDNSGTINYVTQIGIDAFSRWRVSRRGTNPLPVELVNFSAIITNNNVVLTWATATEINNDFFIIERSTDGINFAEVKQIKGAGNSNKLIEYSYIDFPNESSTIYYYRLKQIDFDGKFEYSNVIAITVDDIKSMKAEVTIYPNPVIGTEGLYVNFMGVNKNEIIEITITDLTGKLIFDNKIMSTERPFIYYLNLNNTLTSGSYFIQFRGNSININEKLIVR